MKFIIFTYYGYGLQIAYKLLQEGNDVLVAQVQNNYELGNGDKPEEPEQKKMRLSLYDGIMTKYPATEVIKKMQNIKNKEDIFVIFDLNSLWKYSEMCLKMGFTNGIFPTRADWKLEEEREKGKKIVKKYYPDLEVAEVQEFQKTEDAIKFIEESDDFWVLKGNNDDAETIVPNTKNLEFSKDELIDALKKEKSLYEKDGFILEKKILNPMELTPEAMFYDGKLVSATLDIESKPRAAGDEGHQCGCALDLVCQISQEDEIFKKAFPKFVFDEAKRRKGLFVWDAGILAKDDKFYFTEFCSCRFGWDAIETEIAMSESATDFFLKLSSGENPYKYQYGVSVRGFQPNNDKHELKEERMSWLQSVDKDVWLYDIKLSKEENSVNATTDWDKVVFTGQGETINQAVDRAYEVREGFSFPGLEVRPKYDFLSKEYPCSIINRYNFAIEEGLIREEEEQETNKINTYE